MAARTFSRDIAVVRCSLHCAQSAACRQDRIIRVPAGLRYTVKVSEFGGSSSLEYDRHPVTTGRPPTSVPFKIRRKRIRSVSKIHVL